jgi:hypothetical protein
LPALERVGGASRRKSLPQTVIALGRFVDGRWFRLVGFHGRGEDTPEALIIDPPKILA